MQVDPGNTGEPTTVPDQVDQSANQRGLSRSVLVGERGMLTPTQITTLKEHPGLGWISCPRSGAIRDPLDEGHLKHSVFDRVNRAAIHSPDFPGERLIACYDAVLAEQRRQRRESSLAATEATVAKVARGVARRTKAPLSGAQIGVKAGRVMGRYKMAKHFRLTIRGVSWSGPAMRSRSNRRNYWMGSL